MMTLCDIDRADRMNQDTSLARYSARIYLGCSFQNARLFGDLDQIAQMNSRCM